MSALDALFEELVNRGGTELHLGSNQAPLARVRGDLVALGEASIAPKELESMLLEKATPAQRAQLASQMTLQLSVAHGTSTRFRATYYVKLTGLAAAFRLAPARPKSLAEIGAPESLWKLAERPRGLVLLASPSANGRTTTLAAMVDHVNKTRACNIVTLEAPIEIVYDPQRAQVTQREIGTHTPSLEHALASVGRESPDVVAISELTTSAHFEHALRLASEGVLVLATCRASNVAEAIELLVAGFAQDVRPRVRARLAACLAGVVAQHLVRTPDSKSRLPVFEVLLGSPEVCALVADGKTDALSLAMSSGGDAGMQALDDALERLVNAGKVAPEAAFERAIDKDAFAKVAGKTAL